MKKRALIFGSPESVHVQRFIRLLLTEEEGFGQIVVFNVSHPSKLSKEDLAFYAERGIELISYQPKAYSHRIVRAAMHFYHRGRLLKRYLKKAGRFDYCFVHFCSWQNAMWVSATKKHYDRIVPVFWGGDVLRNRRLHTSIYRRFLSASSHIVLPNENSYRVFQEKTDRKYEPKTYCIQFPNEVCEQMVEAENSISIRDAKREFSLPEGKRIVICGHTATRAEQYETMIDMLKNCDEAVLSACHFVFMMTYAPDDYRPYQAEIEEKLRGTGLSFTVLKEFLSQEQMIRLHYACDVHITTIRTDAFSCFLQEELLAGNVLIYGTWLKYYEIENDNFFAVPIDTFEELPEALNRVISEYEAHAEASQKNRASLIALESQEAIRESWRANVFHSEERKEL